MPYHSPPASAAQGTPPIIYGYYPVDYPGDRTAFNSLLTATPVNTVGAFLYRIDAQGNVSGEMDHALMDLARQRNIEVQAVIHNYWGGFDRGVVSSILTNATAQARALDQITRLVTEAGYDGVQIDLENVDPAQRQLFTQFLQRLAERLRPSGATLSIAVPAKTWDDPNNGWSGAFDYRAIGQVVDQVVLMTYDEHWITSGAGPIASMPWVSDVVRYASQTIPTHKLLVGIAGYGYDWPSTGGMATMLKASDAVRLAQQKGVPILWDAGAQVPYFSYAENGVTRVVYFENAESARYKLQLIGRHDLGGMALWRLGFEDPALWDVVEEILGGGTRPPGGEPPGEQPPGQEPPQGSRYVVQTGDTLYLIGLRYGISWQAILAANPGLDPYNLIPGQSIVIPSGSAPPGGSTYVVQPGDTLWLIAQRYGLSLDALMAANPGIDAWWLMPGQVLVLPSGTRPGQGRSYTVRPGDTLYLIGRRYGVDWQAILAANPGIDPYNLLPGQVIVLPGV
ncbi:LysM peptidoglycan-binding domain-containing protein [Geochorda subterranea]|uniref:LysM peptidoglycan-binding domain-containing protein n=1 Tax=Geochorda subterranea TaxID=3109564 RepID=A0ABZ1BQG6_9FIRM|nr:LysM peptidoglycan-binding domain-containing protein [Limnochorda sp. LNt]WRP14811.1 LysM peptidoglycan-binding domain-containing protein [Limnochorda sp. LNt]